MLDDDFSEEELPPIPYQRMVEEAAKAARTERLKLPKETPPVPTEKAYRLVAPIQRPGVADDINRQITETKVEVKLGDLIAMAPELAKRLRQAITKTRRPLVKPVLAGGVFAQESAFPFMEEPGYSKLEYDAIDVAELPMVDSMYVATNEDVGVPVGSIIVSDPYLQYLAELGPGEAPKQVFVYSARESAPLRVVFPLVTGREKVESVMDSGSQIVSMALSTAERLMIPWDPDIQIYMQSANGQLKKSAGLARNVAFLFGDVTIYLQVHVIDQPAYQVLLGRPFEILTESTIRNKMDGSQTLTICDPNNKKRCTMTTHARSEYKVASQPKKVQKHPRVEEVPDEEDDLEYPHKPKAKPENPQTEGFRHSSMN